jgi:hypothetical protein
MTLGSNTKALCLPTLSPNPRSNREHAKASAQNNQSSATVSLELRHHSLPPPKGPPGLSRSIIWNSDLLTKEEGGHQRIQKRLK